MGSVNPQLQRVRLLEGNGARLMEIPIRVDENAGGFEVDDVASRLMINGGGDDAQVNSANDGENIASLHSRTSELTISFEGEVYVFQAVTPEKVQAVLLLLGGHEIRNGVPSSECRMLQNNGCVGDASQYPNPSRRIASLVRFREKRKERCFEKKIRYTCRKEVAQRMHRQNGQFASLKESYKMASGNWDSNGSTPGSEYVSRKCQHCGINEKSTPAMRRGPAGPRSLCNACGLMWANKGTLRDLTKGGRNVSFDQNELDSSSDIKPLAIDMDLENLFNDQDEEGSPEETKPLPLQSGNFSMRQKQQDLLLTASAVRGNLQLKAGNTSGNLEGQGTLDELANA